MESVTAVLTKFRRTRWLFDRQLTAVQNQTYPVEKILVHDNRENNYGPWARFATALMATTDWIWVIDDDIHPNSAWLEKAMKANAVQPALRGPSGTILPAGVKEPMIDGYGEQNWLEIGAAKAFHNDEIAEDTQVDFVIQGYLFKREWLKWFWEKDFKDSSEWFYSEDQWLSWQCHKHGIPRYAQGWDRNDDRTRGTTGYFAEMGLKDERGLWAAGSWEYRNRYADHWRQLIKQGFKPINHA